MAALVTMDGKPDRLLDGFDGLDDDDKAPSLAEVLRLPRLRAQPQG